MTAMYQLENESVSVTLNELAGIIGIFDKRTSCEYISVDDVSNGFRVMLPNEHWDGCYADAAMQNKPAAQEKKDQVIFVFPALITKDNRRTKVKLTVFYQLCGDELKAGYLIENKDEHELVTHVMFPIIAGIGKDQSDRRLVMPEQSPFGDSRIEDPFSYGDGNHLDWVRNCCRKSVRYPQLLSASWLDYGSDRGGISLEQRCDAFSVCDMGFERIIKKDKYTKANNTDCLQLAIQSYPNVKYKEVITSPEYIIGIHPGNWRMPAMRHRNWLKERVKIPDTPKEFQQALGWHFFFMKQQDGTVYRNYHDLPAMADAALMAGFSYLMTFGWYKEGHDNEYPFGYYVNEEWGGKEELRKQLAVCEGKGCHVIPFFNGTLLDISTKEYTEYGHRWPVLGRTGKPYCGTEFSRANHDMGFSNACLATSTRNMTLLDICIAAKVVRQWWKETVQRIVGEYGFGNLQLDQIAHKSYVCYDSAHQHKRPETAYTSELEELLAMVRDTVKKENSAGVMIGEGMTDLAMQYCDGFWNWHQAWNHPEIMRYSIPWMNYSHEVDANEFDAVNLCFAERILIDLKIQGGDGIVSDYPLFCRHLKALSDLKKKLGEAYLTGEYFYQDDFVRTAGEGVVIRLYKKENHRAVVAANITSEETSWETELSYPLKDVHTFSSGEEKKNASGACFSYRLRPYEVMVIEGVCVIRKDKANDSKFIEEK